MLWSFFGVIFALLPVGIDILQEAHSHAFNFMNILEKGEQFVIFGVGTLGAAGEVFAAEFPPDDKNRSLFVGFSALGVGLSNILLYAFIPSGSPLVWTTITLALAAVITSGTCIGMAAGR